MATAEATVVTGAAAEAKVRVTLGTRCCLENSDASVFTMKQKSHPRVACAFKWCAVRDSNPRRTDS